MADMKFEDLNILRGLSSVEQLTGQDAAFVYGESRKGPMHIGSVNIYDPSTAPGGKVRYKDILKFVESRIHKTKTFTQKLQKVPFNLDHPYWVEDQDFDIEFHVRHIALPAPGDWRQLCILAARLHSRPLDMDKPLWEMWVVEGLDNIKNIPKGSYAIISKIHHAAIDGVSGVEIAQATHTLTPKVVTEDGPVDLRRPRRLSNLETIVRANFNNLTIPFHGLKMAGQMVPGTLKYLSGVRSGEFSLFRNAVPRTRFNSTVSGRRVFGGHLFDLDAIKSIRKKSPGSTINDVMLTIVGGALREYLMAKSDLPAESLIAMAPVSVRSEKEKGAMGNEVSALSVALGTHIEDPLARLHYVTATTQESKAMANAIGARQLSDASKLAPAMVAGVAARLYTRLGLANQIKPLFNTVVSNVPGPQVPLYMNGARMVASYGLGPVMDSVGLFHAVTSYCGEMAVSYAADRKMIPDPDFYADCLWGSYETLYAATHEAAAPRKRHRSHTKKIKGMPSGSSALKKAAVKKAAKPVPVKAETPKAVKPAVKPAPAPKPASTSAQDDLTRINGIGPVLNKHLNAAGLYTFAQVAELNTAEIDAIEETLNFKGRIAREEWLKQAKALTAPKTTKA